MASLALMKPALEYRPDVDGLRAVAVLRAPSQRWSELLFAGGIAAILASILLFNDLTVFPGYAVLLPAVGSALVLYAAANARSASFLRSWPAVYVGQISYSLYLVHWPLIAFTHYLLNRPLTPVHQSTLIVVAIVLAHLSYRYIERPFRRPRLDARRGNASIYLGCAAAACVVLAPALHAGLTGGWVWRFPADLQAINSIDVDAQKLYVWKNFNRLQTPAFTSSKRHVLVVGDSQAADLMNMLVAAGFERKNELITRTVLWECGMPYMPEGKGDTFWKTENSHTIKNPALIDTCKEEYKGIADGPAIRDAEYVIVSYFWREDALGKIDEAVRDLSLRTKAKILLLGSKGFDESSIQFANRLGNLEGLEKLAADHVTAATRNANRFMADNFPDRFVDVLSAICPRADFCHVLTGENKPIYWDPTHLTSYGAEYLGRSLAAPLFPFLSR